MTTRTKGRNGGDRATPKNDKDNASCTIHYGGHEQVAIVAHTMKPERQRKQEILAAALVLAERDGLTTMTRDGIAVEASVSTGLVNAHFGTMAKLRRAVVGEAVRVGCLPVLAQALAMRDPLACNAPDELKRAAAFSIAVKL